MVSGRHLALRWSFLVLFSSCPVLALNGCARFQEARSYEVKNTADPSASFEAVEEVVKKQGYQVVERDDERRLVKLRTHIDEKSSSRASYISVEVEDTGHVKLTPSGFLVHPDGTIHQKLDQEVTTLETEIAGRLQQGVKPASAPSSAVAASPAPAAADTTPHAWLEPAADKAKWGPGDFTCLPVHIPVEDQAGMALRLESGELANVKLTLAYDAALCQSKAACAEAEGCPALGIGDDAEVAALAKRLGGGEIDKTATLLHRGRPAAIVDLSRHGSVVQAAGSK